LPTPSTLIVVHGPRRSALTMSPILPLDIIYLIIDTVGGKNDTNLLKELALVSHFFLPICSKHLFATVELHNADPDNHVASSKKGFVKLLKSRPDVVKYIRKLIYTMGYATTKIICSHPAFQISFEQFLVSTASQSLLICIGNGLHWTLP